jgi:hypothetical protein
MTRLTVLTLSLLMSTACDSGPEQPAVPKTAADAKPAAEAKAGDTKMPPGHGAMGDTQANPHAMAGPHGGMGGGMGGGPMGAAPPSGPPRDVTPSGEAVESNLRGLKVATPKEWEATPPSSGMRVAQWTVPGPGGDAELVVFRFAGGGGGVQANVDRWKGQFTPPQGKTIDDVTTVKEIEGSDGLQTTLVDVAGTFVAAVQPGADEKHNDSNYRMLAAIVQGQGDPYYFKLVGPSKTVDLWAPPFETMIGTFAKGDAPPAGPAAGTADAKADAKADTKADAKADAKAG